MRATLLSPEQQFQTINVKMKNLSKPNIRIWLAWAFVGIPAFWGVLQTLMKVTALFR
jgi:hypothetical protein